jgi:hypothetical protein
MKPTQVTIEPVPEVVFIRELATSRRVDVAFAIHNLGGCELELVAVERNVRAEDGSLLERRTVDGNIRIAPGDRRVVSNPLSEFGRGIPLVSLVYTFAIRVPWDEMLYVPVAVAPIQGATPVQLVRAA